LSLREERKLNTGILHSVQDDDFKREDDFIREDDFNRRTS